MFMITRVQEHFAKKNKTVFDHKHFWRQHYACLFYSCMKQQTETSIWQILFVHP